MKTVIFIVICTALLSAPFIIAQEPTQTSDSGQVIEALEQLEAIGRDNPRSDTLELTEKLSDKITEVVHALKSAQALAKLAISCLALSSDFNVGDDPDCAIYDQAYWECIKRVSAIEGEEGRKSLQMIVRYSDLQSGNLKRFIAIKTKNSNK